MATKNILIGKVGKSVKLTTVDISTGDDAPMIFYSTVARMNPDYNFYFIGPNELRKLDEAQYEHLFPNKNVFSAFKKDDSLAEPFKPTVDYFKENNITPDFALLFCGMVSGVNVPNFLKKEGTDEYVKILNSYKSYAGPYIYVMNELGVPYFGIAEDARYITVNAKDLYNKERLVFSQINEKFTPVKHVTSKTDLTLTTETIEAIYSGVERIFMMGLPEDWKDKINVEKKITDKEHAKFIVISNGCGTKAMNTATGNKASRLPTYEKWILNNFKGTEFDNTKIYGTWDPKAYEKWPDKIVYKRLCNMQEEIENAKYALVYSQQPGFVTVKAWEMTTLGLIPFIHPDYDKDRLLNFPEFCYPKTPEELLERVRQLEADDELYKKVLNDCFAMIKPEYMDGSDLNNFIFTRIGEELGYEYEKKQGVKSIFNHFGQDVVKFGEKKEEKVETKTPSESKKVKALF